MKIFRYLRQVKGLNEETIRQISKIKQEPKWMLDFRLQSFKYFKKTPLPSFGVDLSFLNFDDYTLFYKINKKRCHFLG